MFAFSKGRSIAMFRVDFTPMFTSHRLKLTSREATEASQKWSIISVAMPQSQDLAVVDVVSLVRLHPRISLDSLRFQVRRSQCLCTWSLAAKKVRYIDWQILQCGRTQHPIQTEMNVSKSPSTTSVPGRPHRPQ
jgi:hypothetical protein